jgi:hypothetical protein
MSKESYSGAKETYKFEVQASVKREVGRYLLRHKIDLLRRKRDL